MLFASLDAENHCEHLESHLWDLDYHLGGINRGIMGVRLMEDMLKWQDYTWATYCVCVLQRDSLLAQLGLLHM